MRRLASRLGRREAAVVVRAGRHLQQRQVAAAGGRLGKVVMRVARPPVARLDFLASHSVERPGTPGKLHIQISEQVVVGAHLPGRLVGQAAITWAVAREVAARERDWRQALLRPVGRALDRSVACRMRVGPPAV